MAKFLQMDILEYVLKAIYIYYNFELSPSINEVLTMLPESIGPFPAFKWSLHTSLTWYSHTQPRLYRRRYNNNSNIIIITNVFIYHKIKTTYLMLHNYNPNKI